MAGNIWFHHKNERKLSNFAPPVFDTSGNGSGEREGPPRQKEKEEEEGRMETAIVPAAVAWDMFDSGPGKQCFLAAPPRGAKLLEFVAANRAWSKFVIYCRRIAVCYRNVKKLQSEQLPEKKTLQFLGRFFLQQILYRPNFCFERVFPLRVWIRVLFLLRAYFFPPPFV